MKYALLAQPVRGGMSTLAGEADIGDRLLERPSLPRTEYSAPFVDAPLAQ
jgi:hypothetical protein